MNLAGHEFEERELLRRVVRNLRPTKRQRYIQRWVLVRNAFGCGSTVARALCCEFGLEPDEELE